LQNLLQEHIAEGFCFYDLLAQTKIKFGVFFTLPSKENGFCASLIE
jgi:hypothetical protein